MENEVESGGAPETTEEQGVQSESFGETLSFLNAHITETESAFHRELGSEGERLLLLINQPA